MFTEKLTQRIFQISQQNSDFSTFFICRDPDKILFQLLGRPQTF